MMDCALKKKKGICLVYLNNSDCITEGRREGAEREGRGQGD